MEEFTVILVAVLLAFFSLGYILGLHCWILFEAGRKFSEKTAGDGRRQRFSDEKVFRVFNARFFKN